MLVESGNVSTSAVHTWADPYEYGVDTNNQWGVVSWILPRIAVPVKTTQSLSQDLEDVLRKFLLAKAAKDRTRNDLQQGIINKEVFGTTISLIAWRTLELYSQSASCRKQASIQAQKAVNRLLHSLPDILGLPLEYPDKEPEALEGYLGWTGLCLAAASLGIRISAGEYQKELNIAEELNSAIGLHLSRKQQQSSFSKLIHQIDDFSPQTAAAIIRGATKVAELYKTIL